jgi:hypothetical protein
MVKDYRIGGMGSNATLSNLRTIVPRGTSLGIGRLARRRPKKQTTTHQTRPMWSIPVVRAARPTIIKGGIQ